MNGFRFASLLIVCLLVIVSMQTAQAQNALPKSFTGAATIEAVSPTTFAVQGVLRDPAGRSVDDATYTLTFALYTVSGGGSNIWTETINNVKVTHGVFAVKLGAITPLTSLNFTDPYWLGITVQGSTELSPRIELVKSPSALSVVGSSNILPSTGSAGVGTLTPGSKLEVRSTGSTSSTSGLNVTNIRGTSELLVRDDGNVGIATTTPDSKLTVRGTGRTNATAGLNVTDSAGASGIYVRDDGNVGIGTTSPNSKVEVSGDIRLTAGGTGKIIFADNSTLSTSNLGGAASSVTNPTDAVIGADVDANASGAILFNIGASTKMKITNGGNFGLESNDMLVKSSSDTNHGLGYYGTGKLWKGVAIDGPVLYGFGGGVLGTNQNGVKTSPLAWTTTGVNITGGMSVTGNLTVSGTTPNSHNHFGQTWNGSSGTGFYIQNTSSSGYGIRSDANIGVLGYARTGAGGFTPVGVLGESDLSAGYGIWGYNTGAPGFAGYFNGNVNVAGTLSKSAGSFKIDHPLDPDNKFLYHSFVESPDMMNIYNGNITTNASGDATVQLPSYFEALNQDFRYQLTVIGQFAQAIVAQEVHGNTFTLKTDKPNVKVSWQVTGIRHDAYAAAHRIVPEVAKTASEKGKYIHPVELGKAESLQMDYENHEKVKAAQQADQNKK